jgi:hypothetical protein
LRLELDATQGVVAELRQVEQEHVELLEIDAQLREKHGQLSDKFTSLESVKAATAQALKVLAVPSSCE